MFPDELRTTARAIQGRYATRGWMLATAESCTGGLLAGCLTGVPGSSHVVERGFLTYTNAAKSDLLGVPPAMIARHGAVSGEVAEAMAAGALLRAPVDVAISITGIAGPGGGTAEKPCGLVYFALALRKTPTRRVHHIFDGDRDEVRLRSVATALALLLEAAEQHGERQ